MTVQKMLWELTLKLRDQSHVSTIKIDYMEQTVIDIIGKMWVFKESENIIYADLKSKESFDAKDALIISNNKELDLFVECILDFGFEFPMDLRPLLD